MRDFDLYRLKLHREQLRIESAIDTNRKFEKLKKQKVFADDLVADAKKQIADLQRLLQVIKVEEGNFRERRLNYIGECITQALEKIFPNERFRASVECDVSRGKNLAQLVLTDSSGNERMPFVQEGKMCQYLISFAAIRGVTEALGSDAVYIDEAFGAASLDNVQKVGPILEQMAESGTQIILVSQNPALYDGIAHREICFHKDDSEQRVVIDSVTDYRKS